MPIRCRSEALVLIAALALAACKPLGEKAETLPPVGAEAVALEKAACQGKGGEWAKLNGGEFCVMMTKDGGKACHAGSDCEGDCLARSQTCAPAKPLLGCNEVLLEGGMRMTQCVE